MLTLLESFLLLMLCIIYVGGFGTRSVQFQFGKRETRILIDQTPRCPLYLYISISKDQCALRIGRSLLRTSCPTVDPNSIDSGCLD